jgi:hypothetical protein
MAFTKFTARNSKYETRISISRSNSFGLPTQFYKEENIGQYQFVVLYFDPDALKIAFNFTNDMSEPGKFSITKSREYGASVVAASFFKGNRIDATRYYGKYDWKKVPARELEIDEDSMLYVIQMQDRSDILTSELES